MATLLRLLQPVESDWDTLATFLLKDELQHKIKAIESDCFHDDSEKGLFQVISKWLDCTEASKRTWQTLCDTGKKYGDGSLVQYMESNGLQSKSKCLWTIAILC